MFQHLQQQFHTHTHTHQPASQSVHSPYFQKCLYYLHSFVFTVESGLFMNAFRNRWRIKTFRDSQEQSSPPSRFSASASSTLASSHHFCLSFSPLPLQISLLRSLFLSCCLIASFLLSLSSCTPSTPFFYLPLYTRILSCLLPFLFFIIFSSPSPSTPPLYIPLSSCSCPSPLHSPLVLPPLSPPTPPSSSFTVFSPHYPPLPPLLLPPPAWFRSLLVSLPSLHTTCILSMVFIAQLSRVTLSLYTHIHMCLYPC